MFVVCCESLRLSGTMQKPTAPLSKDLCDVMWCVFSPHSHLTVHHAREVKLSQQILHLVVFLAVLLHVSMVTRDVWAQHVPHEEGQTALLTITVFLKDINNKLLLFYTLAGTDSVLIFSNVEPLSTRMWKGVLLLIYGRWLPPWSSL